MFAAVALALIALVGVQGVQVGVVDIHATTSCDSGKAASLPFLLGNTCSTIVEGLAMKFDCTQSKLEIFTDRACATPLGIGLAGGLDFTCQPGQTVNGITFPAQGFSCQEFPDNNVILITIGGACTSSNSTDVSGTISLSFALVVNTCMKVPPTLAQQSASAATAAGSFYKVAVSTSKTVTYTTFTDAACSQGASVLYTGVLDGCNTVIAAGRRLDSGVVFKTAVPGAHITTSDSASGMAVNLFAMIALFVSTLAIIA